MRVSMPGMLKLDWARKVQAKRATAQCASKANGFRQAYTCHGTWDLMKAVTVDLGHYVVCKVLTEST